MSQTRKKVDLDNPEWTRADFATAGRPDAVLPGEVLAAFPRTTRSDPREMKETIMRPDDISSHDFEQDPELTLRMANEWPVVITD
jgi:hypothetical protein